MAYLSDASGHSTRMGRLLHESNHDIGLDETVDLLFQEMDLKSDDKVDSYMREIERMESDGVSIIHFFSRDFPAQLREIHDTPIILYLKGKCRDFTKCIAISGARNPSSKGHRAAREMAIHLAENGFTIVAGFARGIDLDAHQGVLEVGGRTFAVLPSAISDIYPKEHTRLSEEVINRGLLISEMSSLERMNRLSFIRRNRITTGLSQCLIIGESDGTGGTLQQFKIATKQGRPVFMIRPEESDNHAMKGFKHFTKKGAIPVESGQDVIDSLKMNTKGQVTLGDF